MVKIYNIVRTINQDNYDEACGVIERLPRYNRATIIDLA